MVNKIRDDGALAISERHTVVHTNMWGPVFAGALLCIVLQLMFTFLGSGIGLSTLSIHDREPLGTGELIAAGIFTLVAIAVSFFAGGYLTVFMDGIRRKAGAVCRGLMVWSVVSLSFTILLGTALSFSLGPLLGRAGLGVMGTSEQAKDFGAIIDYDNKTRTGEYQYFPRKADSQRTERYYQQKKDDALAEKVESVQKTTAGASWIAFVALAIGALFSILGGLSAQNRPLLPPEEEVINIREAA